MAHERPRHIYTTRNLWNSNTSEGPVSSIADSSAIRDATRAFPQHQAAVTLLQSLLADPTREMLRWLDLGFPAIASVNCAAEKAGTLSGFPASDCVVAACLKSGTDTWLRATKR